MRCSISVILDSAHVRIAPLRSLLSAVIVVVCSTVVSAGFVAPYGYATQHRLSPLCPPTRIHYHDRQGRFYLRPFVYDWKPHSNLDNNYEEDRSTAYPIRFFVTGARYRIFGLFAADIHLFEASDGGQLFLLGTDALGRDVFTRLLYGGQNSLFAGLAAATIAVSVGLVLGGLAGYFGGRTDKIIMRAAELFLSVPWLFLLLTIRAFLPTRLSALAVFLLLMSVSGLIGWARPARLVRGVVLSARQREYVLAARSFGASHLYILRRHVLPHAYSVTLTQLILYIPQYITAEATLSFFGLGISEPEPSWGNMLAELRTLFVLENCWWLFAPAVALVLALATIHFSASLAFRSKLDPDNPAPRYL